MSTIAVGILAGSVRPTGNGAGITSWLIPRLHSGISKASPGSTASVKTINFGALDLPFFNEDALPAAVTTCEGYTNDAVRKWSQQLSSFDVVVIVTPQFNWGYPAVLKNAIDCLYHEWKGKPILLVTYGSRGGGKAAEQLRQVLEGGVKARVLPTTLEIALDRGMVDGMKRVASDWEGMRKHETVLNEAIRELTERLGDRSTPSP